MLSLGLNLLGRVRRAYDFLGGASVLPDAYDLRVERLRGATGAEDTHGNPVVDWANPAKLIIDGCWIGRPSGIEMSEGRQTVLTEQWWYGPEDADVLETDRIRARGVTYEVSGPVFFEDDPVGPYSHKTCQLREVRG
jgi:hypothetical protein